MEFENLKINYVLEDVSGHGDFRDSQDFLLGYFEAQENRLQYRYDAETVWIEAWGKNSLRVRATKCYKMPEEDWALTEVPEKTDAGFLLFVLWSGTDGGLLSGVLVFLQCGWFAIDCIRNAAGKEKIRHIPVSSRIYCSKL